MLLLAIESTSRRIKAGAIYSVAHAGADVYNIRRSLRSKAKTVMVERTVVTIANGFILVTGFIQKKPKLFRVFRVKFKPA